MKIVLLKDVPKVGRKYDVKDVSDGHALNMLIPQGLAETATKTAVKRAEAARKAEADERKVMEDLLAKNIKDVESATIEISGNGSEKGHLFAGIHKEKLAEEIKKQTGLDVNSEFIKLEHPIKEAGEHLIEVSAGGKTAKFKLVVKIEGK